MNSPQKRAASHLSEEAAPPLQLSLASMREARPDLFERFDYLARLHSLADNVEVWGPTPLYNLCFDLGRLQDWRAIGSEVAACAYDELDRLTGDLRAEVRAGVKAGGGRFELYAHDRHVRGMDIVIDGGGYQLTLDMLIGRLTPINQPLYGDGTSAHTTPLLSSGGMTTPKFTGAVKWYSPQEHRDLFHEAIHYQRRSGGTGLPSSLIHRGLIQETVKQSLGRQPVLEAYAYDERLRLTGFEAHELYSAGQSTVSAYADSRHAKAGYAYDDFSRITAIKRWGQTSGANPTDVVFDNLGHYHRSSDQLAPTTVFDFARRNTGHKNGSYSSSATTYTYNDAGDVTYDANKGISYDYNALGLVSRVTKGQAEWAYRYSGDGTLRTAVEKNTSGAVVSEVIYAGGHRFDVERDETYVQTPYGATVLDSRSTTAPVTAKHVGYHADHLRVNGVSGPRSRVVMLAYSDLDGDGDGDGYGDGVIDPRTEILEESRYYPYGLKLEAYTKQSRELPFAYNGAEGLEGEFGLQVTTYRTMAPEVGLWSQTDPKASLNYAYSPYSSMNGNPISYNDPHGDIVAPLGYLLATATVVGAKSVGLTFGAKIAFAAGAFGGGGLICPTCINAGQPAQLPTINVYANPPQGTFVDQSTQRYGYNGTFDQWTAQYGVHGENFQTALSSWRQIHGAAHAKYVARMDALEMMSRLQPFVDYMSMISTVLAPGAGVTPGVSAVAPKAFALRFPVRGVTQGVGLQVLPRTALRPTHGITKGKAGFKRLYNDIRQNGVEEPISYVRDQGARYIVNGHHRYFAAQKLGIRNLPAREVTLPFRGYKTTGDLIPNIHRAGWYRGWARYH